MSKRSCPHCGMVYDTEDVPWHLRSVSNLVPEHFHVVRLPSQMSAAALESGASEEEQRCPGSWQAPRNPESDRRPLWKDGGVP